MYGYHRLYIPMPLTPKGEKIMGAMQDSYGSDKGKSVFYASRNKGRIHGVDKGGRGSRKSSKRASGRSATARRR